MMIMNQDEAVPDEKYDDLSEKQANNTLMVDA